MKSLSIFYLLYGNWNFSKQQMKEENTFESMFLEMCVLETRAREKKYTKSAANNSLSKYSWRHKESFI